MQLDHPLIHDNQNIPGSHYYAGLGYFYALAKEQLEEFTIDCQDDRSAVLKAFSMGFKQVRFTGKKEIFEKLSEIAKQCNITLIA